MMPIYIAGFMIIAIAIVCVTVTMVTMIRVQAAERRDLYTRIQCRDIGDYKRYTDNKQTDDTSPEEKAIDDWINYGGV